MIDISIVLKNGQILGKHYTMFTCTELTQLIKKYYSRYDAIDFDGKNIYKEDILNIYIVEVN
jgi:hypothetical protein